MLTEIEKWLLRELLDRHYISSGEVKEKLGIPAGRGRHALTNANFPTLRPFLHTFMTAHNKGMCRGGYLWFSAIEWKAGIIDLEARYGFLLQNPRS